VGLAGLVVTVRVWVDIENPPQVQYLLPFKEAFEQAGHEVTLTARDYGITFELLAKRGVEFHSLGSEYGKGKARKILGLLGRIGRMRAFFRGYPAPHAVVHAGRASEFVARLLRIPSFALVDYEYVDLTAERLTRSYVLYPDVIETAVLRARGIREDRLLPFRGLKEDISFAGLDLESVAPYELPGVPEELVRVLFRPPAEESHYYKSESGRLALDLLGHLAREESAVVVLAPRYPRQADYLRRYEWRNEPVVLAEAAPFASLLKSVDLVVSSGGTMVREAAYLGVPSVSIFQGEPGGVDRHLASLGRLRLVGSPSDFSELGLAKVNGARPLASNPDLLDELVLMISERTVAHRARRPSALS
jgi:uncharacterized protein